MPTLVDHAAQNKYFIQHTAALRSPGRPKGSKNRIPVHVRSSIARVYDALGGDEGMFAFALDHPVEFYSVIVPKIIPSELAESGAGQHIQVFVYGKPVPNPKQINSDTTCQEHVGSVAQHIDNTEKPNE